jgi:hypothetical protein
MTVTWTYLSYSWKAAGTTFNGNVLPAITSTKVTSTTVLAITADDEFDASASAALTSAELALSVPVEATTALGSTPAELGGAIPTGLPGGGNSNGGPGGVPGAAARLGAARDIWGIAVGTALALGVAVVMVAL